MLPLDHQLHRPVHGPVGLNGFLGQQGSQWHLLMAASTISMLPTVIMVLLLQRHLVRGIALSGLGGR